jgi:hypothetical protein
MSHTAGSDVVTFVSVTSPLQKAPEQRKQPSELAGAPQAKRKRDTL